MDESIVRQIVEELISSLEPLEAQSAALLEFCKDKGIVNNEELAPYLERAGNASDVRWRAFRVRTLSLISSAMKTPGDEKAEEPKNPSGAPDRENVNSTREERAGSGREASPSSERAAEAEPKNETEEQGQESREPRTPGQKDAA